jgi:hypothetical protein
VMKSRGIWTEDRCVIVDPKKVRQRAILIPTLLLLLLFLRARESINALKKTYGTDEIVAERHVSV